MGHSPTQLGDGKIRQINLDLKGVSITRGFRPCVNLLSFLACLAVSFTQQAFAQEAYDLPPSSGDSTNSSSSNSKGDGNTDNAFQWWTPIYLDTPVCKNKKVRGYLDVQPRLGDSLNGINQLLLRQGIGYRFTPHLSAYVGHAWLSNFQPEYRNEQRIWQQLGYGHVLFKKIQVLHRLRMEERFISQTGDNCSLRGRYFIRLVYPLRRGFYLLGSEELFVNFNTIGNGPVSGIDQNRFFAGIGKQITKNLRSEIGYQQQYTNRRDDVDDKANHALITQMFISL